MILAVSVTQLQSAACASWDEAEGFDRSAVAMNAGELNFKTLETRDDQACGQ